MPVRPAGHLGNGTDAALALGAALGVEGGVEVLAAGVAEALALAVAVADAVAAAPFASSLSQAVRAITSPRPMVLARMGEQSTPISATPVASMPPEEESPPQPKRQVHGRAVGPDDLLPGVKNIVLVMSGKGGVGKSSVATNLAMSLTRAGYRVGLLDADIYGPSIPTMLGVGGRPVSLDGKTIEPLARFGLKLMSIGFLLEDPKAAVIWRGPMLHGALQQFMKDVSWGELDFLVMDLPPGTGDIALTLSQKVKVTGAVMVTTPQSVATDDVYKSPCRCARR